MKRRVLFLLSVLSIDFGLLSCHVEVTNLLGNKKDGTYNNVDPALWPYFKRFEDEGAKRNMPMDLNDARITGVISDIPTSHVLGQCSYSTDNPKKLTIDQPFWSSASDLFKEFVVFHELGHCYLGRLHDESMDAGGVCVSIMRSGTGTCRDNYTAVTRKAYLDELFFNNQ